MGAQAAHVPPRSLTRPTRPSYDHQHNVLLPPRSRPHTFALARARALHHTPHDQNHTYADRATTSKQATKDAHAPLLLETPIQKTAVNSQDGTNCRAQCPVARTNTSNNSYSPQNRRNNTQNDHRDATNIVTTALDAGNPRSRPHPVPLQHLSRQRNRQKMV